MGRKLRTKRLKYDRKFASSKCQTHEKYYWGSKIPQISLKKDISKDLLDEIGMRKRSRRLLRKLNTIEMKKC
jgi:hypothetical protein